MKRAFCILGLALLAMQSCININEANRAALKEIQALYGGKITYGKNFGTKGNYVSIGIRGTDVPTQFDPSLELAANCIAVIVLNHLSDEEKEDYQGVKVELTNEDGKITQMVDFPIATMIQGRKTHCDDDLALLQDRQYPVFHNRLKSYILEGTALDTFKTTVEDVYAKVDPLLSPVLVGVDTTMMGDTLVATFYHIAQSATDSTAKLLYRTIYSIDNNDDSIWGIHLNELIPKKKQ